MNKPVLLAKSYFEVLRRQFDLRLDDLRGAIEIIDCGFTSIKIHS